MADEPHGLADGIFTGKCRIPLNLTKCDFESGIARKLDGFRFVGLTLDMKKILWAALIALGFSGHALAADIAARPYTKAPPLVAAYDWTGFYIGANAGLGFGRSRSEVVDSGALSHLGGLGAIGGGQLGYNQQFGNIVLGLETDIQGSGMRDNRTCQFCPGEFNFDQKLDWFGTVRGRIGYASGPVLSYFTGGFAYGGAKTSVSFDPVVGAISETRTGWTIGSGVEAALGGNWTGKIEYLYLDLGTQTQVGLLDGLTIPSDIREHIFRVGVNYRIGGIAPYRSEPTANWAGFYAGVNGGSATALNSTTHASNVGGFARIDYNKFNLSPDGYFGGIQAGYNWQSSNWVYGLEADIQGSTQKDDLPCMFECLPNQFIRLDQRLEWFGTVRGRLGYSVGSTLFYGTGGLAYGGVKTNISQIISGTYSAPSFNDVRAGWTVGGGIETPFAWFGKNWTVKTEYLYIDLGTTNDTYTYSFTGGVPASTLVRTDTLSSHIQQHIFRAGLNYQFNSPVIARY